MIGRAGSPDTDNLKIQTYASGLGNGFYAEIDGVRQVEWDDILQTFDDYSLMQTWTYGSVRWGEKNLSHVVLKKGGKIVAASQAIIVTVPFLPIGLAYVNWGPCWQPSGQPKNLNNFRHMIQALYRTYVIDRGLLLRIFPNAVENGSRELREVLEEEGFQKDPYDPPKRTVMVDLSYSLEELRQSLEKRWRHNLVLAERNALTITSGSGIESFRQLMALYEEMKARKKWDPIPDVKYFERIQHDIALPFKMMCMICWHGGAPISGVAVSTVGNTAVLFLAATGSTGLTLRSSYFLQWQVLKWLKSLNVRWYDLFGINRETHPGTYQFKSGLGGKLGSEIDYVGAHQTTNRPITRLSVQTVERGRRIVADRRRTVVTLLRRKAAIS